ncbi:MAG TPA: PAS domain S-box protein [Gammaproteobacteria bacterium]
MTDGNQQAETKAAVDFRAVFDSLPGLFCIVDPRDYRIIAVSDDFMRATMTTRGNVVGRTIFDVFPGVPGDSDSAESVQNLKASLERVKEFRHADELPVLRYPLRNAKGDDEFEERYWSIVNSPVIGGDNALKYIAQRVEDITELVRLKRSEGEANEGRRQLESRTAQMEADIVHRSQELKRLNDHLRFAQRIGNIGSMELNVNDGTRTWSDEVYRILGTDRDTMPPTPETIARMVHPNDKPLLDAARERALRGEQTEFEHRIIRPDGEVRHVRERVQLVADENGQPVRLFGTLQDITENKLTRERLQRSEHLIRVAGQMAKLGAWQLDVSEQRVTWSDEMAAIHDLPPCTSVSLTEAVRYIAPEWRPRIRDALSACVREGKSYDLEFEIITANNRRAWVRAIGQAVHDEQGNVACVQGALQDITQKKETEAEIEKLSRQLTTTLESISDGFATLDKEWHITFVNRQAEKIMQRPREELLGNFLWDEYEDAVGTVFEKEYRRAAKENRTVSFQEYYSPLNIWLDVTVYPSPEGLAVYFRDITDRKRIEAATHESEERTRLIVENALDAAITITSDSVITAWNRQAEATFGWSRDEAIGSHLYELIIPEEFRDAHRRGVEHFLATGDGPLLNRHTEVTALHRNGHEFPAELSIVALKNGDDYIFSAFVRDITERKKTERRIRESEERFRTVAHVTADTVWDWNLLTDTMWWNDGIRSVFGYSREEMAKSSSAWTEKVHHEDRSRVMASLDEAIAGDAEEWEEEYRFLRKDGAARDVLDKGFLIRDETGKAVRMVGGIDDITRRKEHETKLQQQAALLDKARDAIVVRDMNNRITYWNKSAERLYGWTAEEAIGVAVESLFYRDSTVFKDAMQKLMDAAEWSGEIVQRHKDGHLITVEGVWSLVRDDDGTPQAVLAINTDITERLALEEQLRQSQRLESIGKLTGGVAHDFNNLLTVILGNAELMIDQLPEGDRLHKLAEMSRTAAQRGAELTHRLLAFARRQALEPHMIDTNQLVLGMEDLLRRTLLENIDIEIIPMDDAWWAYVDPGQLESVLLNLAINAKDAMPDGGLLTIEINNVELDEEYAASNSEVVPGRYVMIAVSDTGCGIPAENINRVFDPFFTTKEKGKGTGLGLSMAYGFAKQSEGHIKIYSERDQGTTVKLYLPMAKRIEEPVTAAPVVEPEVSGSEKVLVVEDDDLVRQHAASQLQELGYEVLVADDGPKAMQIIKKESDIDLLFTDVIMSGGMTGRELAEMAKRLRPKLKVLYTSGYTENAIVHQGRLDRGVHLLQKPYQRAELAKKLRNVLREPSPGGKDNDRSRSDTR